MTSDFVRSGRLIHRISVRPRHPERPPTPRITVIRPPVYPSMRDGAAKNARGRDTKAAPMALSKRSPDPATIGLEWHDPVITKAVARHTVWRTNAIVPISGRRPRASGTMEVRFDALNSDQRGACSRSCECTIHPEPGPARVNALRCGELLLFVPRAAPAAESRRTAP
jgi:hypothetical protein